MAFNSGVVRVSIPVSSRRVISISSLLLVLAVVLSAESAFGFITTNTNSQTSFNYCASSSIVKSRLPIQQPFTTSHISKTTISTTRQSSMSSTTALNSQSLPTDETLSSLQQIAIKASKLAGEIILGNADGADVLKTKDSTRDLLTLIDPLCEKVSCCYERLCGCGVSGSFAHMICIRYEQIFLANDMIRKIW